MIYLNADVLVLILVIAIVWSYSRWLLATEHRKYQRPRLRTSHYTRRNGR